LVIVVVHLPQHRIKNHQTSSHQLSKEKQMKKILKDYRSKDQHIVAVVSFFNNSAVCFGYKKNMLFIR